MFVSKEGCIQRRKSFSLFFPFWGRNKAKNPRYGWRDMDKGL